MRNEQIIAAVARNVAVAIVREIKAVVSFVRDMDLHHLWLRQMQLGMPAYACVQPGTSTWRTGTGGTTGTSGGSKRGRLLCCPSRISTVGSVKLGRG